MFKIKPHSAVVAVCILSLICLSNPVAAQKKTGSKKGKPNAAADTSKPVLILIPPPEPKTDLGYLRVKKNEVIAAISVVGEKSLDELSAVSIDARLQGQAAGVQVTNVSGAPGSGALTIIRGASTLHAGTMPLYIVDGIPVKTYRFLNPLGKNADNNPLADINPGDIATITVLKDAQATALYGMRGANGVIVVTTTGGTAGKTYLDFSANTGFMSAPKSLPVLNADEYRDYILEKEIARGLSQGEIANGVGRYLLVSTADDQVERYNNNTNWQKEVLGKGAFNNYHLRLRGGDAVAKYSLSVGYTNQTGAIDNSRYERFTARFNLDYKVNKKLTILNTVAYSHGAKKVLDEGNAAETNPLYLATLKSPVLTVWSQDLAGTDLSTVDSADYAGRNNPWAVVNRMKNINSSNRIMAGITGQYALSRFLTLSSGLYADYIRLNETRFRPGAGFLPEEEIIRSASENNGSELMLLNESSLHFNKVFGKHSLNAFVGSAFQSTSQRNEFAMAINSPSDEFTSISATDPQLIDSIASYEPDWRLISFLTGANYVYNEKYILAANIRADGSSRFAKGKQWGYFPSVSAGWRISAEPFFKAKKLITELKLRVSYGLTGNQEVGYTGAYNALVPAIYKNQPGVRLGALGNPDFTWEKTRQFNAGIDLLLLKRIAITADFYNKNTTDLLNYRRLAGTTGFNSYVVNDGAVSNTGVELAVSGKVLQKKFVGWHTRLTVTYNKNKIRSYPQGEDPTENHGQYQATAATGSAIGTFWGYNAIGVYRSTADVQVKNGASNAHPFQGGDIIFEDVDKNGVIDEGDMKEIGNCNPDLFGGFSNTFSYRNFDLNIFVDLALGREVYNAQRAALEAMTNYDNQSVTINDRWRSDGDVTSMPRLLHNDPVGNTRFSSRWIENGSWLRFKAITIGYNIPAKETRKAFKSARIFVTAQNLFTITKYKGYGPEAGSITNPVTYSIDYGNVPQLRAFIAGVHAGF